MDHSMLPMYAQVCCPSYLPTNTLQDQEENANKTVLKLMQELREGGRVDVSIKPICIFLFRDGGPFSVTP